MPSQPRSSAQRASERSGFTLIELMIVVAIIAIIASIAIPSLQNSRKSAIEGKAIGTLKAIATSQEMYRTRFGTFAIDINSLASEGYLVALSGGGYFPEYTLVGYAASPYAWAMSIAPSSPGVTADRFFFVDVSGVIRVNSAGIATSTSPPLD